MNQSNNLNLLLTVKLWGRAGQTVILGIYDSLNSIRQESGSFSKLKRQPKMQELLKKFSKQNQEQGSFEEWKRRKEQSKKEEEITRNNKKRKQEEEETQGAPGKRTKSCLQGSGSEKSLPILNYNVNLVCPGSYRAGVQGDQVQESAVIISQEGKIDNFGVSGVCSRVGKVLLDFENCGKCRQCAVMTADSCTHSCIQQDGDENEKGKHQIKNQ